jgi:hypothetical protein
MDVLIILLIGGLIVIAIIYFYKQKQKMKQIEINQKGEAVRDYFNRVNQEKKLPTINTHILLKSGESAYLQDNVKLFETRKVTKSDRGGGAIRVMKGVYIGGTSGTSRSHDELREIDTGQLILTNKRLIFDGGLNTRDIKLDKIISVSEYIDGIEVAIEGKTKSQLYTGMSNPYLWKNLIYYIRQIPPSGELPTVVVEIK